MKKVMALVALVAMVALSSVAYGQGSATVTVGGTVGIQTATITGCSASIPSIAIGTTPSSPACDISVTHNNAGGYTLALSDGATGYTELRSSSLYATDNTAVIVALTEGDTVGPGTATALAAGTEGWSFYVSSITDAAGVAQDDDQTGGTSGQGDGVLGWNDFSTGEHALDTTDETIVNSTGNFLNGVSTSLIFKGAVDLTTPSASDYTIATTATLALN